ncbi:hypothetical protein [Bradyrhizobium monzae]|uniref:hypothetical protein n=1 Tax=Bradyrhizobium sp. Oc8 TaxID=2876780 RepID=UPI001F167249|nr:hypothetical protein [Bradyrhizobium sp. Oc8]
MKPNRDAARALVDAGFMPLSEYIRQFEQDVVAPGVAPSVEANIDGQINPERRTGRDRRQIDRHVTSR